MHIIFLVLLSILSVRADNYNCNKSCQYCCSNNVCVPKDECTKVIIYILIGVMIITLLIGGLIVTICWLKYKDNCSTMQTLCDDIIGYIRKNPSKYTEIQEEKENDIKVIYNAHDPKNLSNYDRNKLETLAVSQTYQRHKVGESFEDRNTLVGKYNMTLDTMKSLPTMSFSVGTKKFRIPTCEDILSKTKKKDIITGVSLINYKSITKKDDNNNEYDYKLPHNPLNTSIDELHPTERNSEIRNRKHFNKLKEKVFTNMDSREASNRWLKDCWVKDEPNIGVNSTLSNRTIEFKRNNEPHDLKTYISLPSNRLESGHNQTHSKLQSTFRVEHH